MRVPGPAFLHYDFCSIHQTLRVTPAMENVLSQTLWDVGRLGANDTCPSRVREAPKAKSHAE